MLEGRTVVVTGALGALGSNVADALEAAGAKVARLDHVKIAAAQDLVFDGLDLTDAAATTAAMATIVERCGGIDGLVNIAGGFAWHTLADAPAKVWDDMFRINLITAVTASRAALSALSASGSGSIVNIGAGAAAKAVAGMGPYAASKAAVAKLTESLAEELAMLDSAGEIFDDASVLAGKTTPVFFGMLWSVISRSYALACNASQATAPFSALSTS